MEARNFVEIKMNGNFNREKQSPMKALLKLAGNAKNMKKISISKREIRPHINNNNNKLAKINSASNVNQNNSNLQKIKNSFMQNNENYNYNNNSIIIKKISIIKKKDKINKNITTNYLNSNNNEEERKSGIIVKKIKNIKNMKNMKNKKLEINESNEINQRKIITIDNDNSKKNKTKIIYNKTNCDKKNKEKNMIIKNNNTTFFNARLEISNKKEDKAINYLTLKSNNNNNNDNLINQKQIEIPDTSKNASCINFYNRYLKNNYNKKINTQNNNINNNNINEKVINSYQFKKKANNININDESKRVYSTLNNDGFISNRFNLITKKNIQNKNQNIIRNGNIIINTDNNDIEIYNENLLKKIIYSPKKGIYRVHSQGNVNSKKKEEYKTIEEKNYIYKTKSARDLKDLTYSKKKCVSNGKNNYNKEKKYGIIDISDNSPSQNSDTKIDNNNLNEKNNNIKTIINIDSSGNKNDEQKDIKPYGYPGIKIMLKSKKLKKPNNNSVIVEHKYYNFDENEECFPDDNYEKRLSNIYRKFNKNSFIKKYKENYYNNTNKNINCISDISNINKSIGYSNTNISLITLSDSNLNAFLNNDMMNNKNLKTNVNDTILSMNDLYNILILEEKLKDIFNALLTDNSNSDIISTYCFELINYFCYFSMDKSIKNIINDKIDQKNIIIFNNHILLAVIIFYDSPSNKNVFKSLEILIKELLKLIYSNIIIVIKYTNNILNNLEKEENNNTYELYDIINNILNKYLNNKELYIEDSTYMLSNKNFEYFEEDKFYSNINFIIRNIQIIINNMKNTKNYNHILNIFKMINNVTIEEINLVFKTKIKKINTFNASLNTSTILKNNTFQNKKKRIFAPYITSINNKKNTLILSLDDTIIHFKTNTIIDYKGIMQIRPGLIEFFQNIKSYYEIIIFSLGNKQYTDAIIDSIDINNKYIDYRLYQEHCIKINGDYVKDLSKIGRAIDKIIIVDNLPQNYKLHKDNGINIKSFYGDNPNDKVLFHLSKILINIAQNGGDIRKGIKKYRNEIIFKVCSNITNNYCK